MQKCIMHKCIKTVNIVKKNEKLFHQLKACVLLMWTKSENMNKMLTGFLPSCIMTVYFHIICH